MKDINDLHASQLDELKEVKLQTLKKDLAFGLDQADRGELMDGDQVFTELCKKNVVMNKKSTFNSLSVFFMLSEMWNLFLANNLY